MSVPREGADSGPFLPDRDLDLADAIGVVILTGLGSAAGFGLLLAVLGVFDPLVTAAVALTTTAVIAVRVLRGSVEMRMTLPAAAVLLLAVGWVGANAGHASQHLASNRDPGIYATAGWWLSESPTPAIDIAPGIVETADRRIRLRGFNADRGDAAISPLFPEGLPVVLAVAGSLGGTGAFFIAPILIGAAGIFMLFLFARTLIRGWWAVLAPVALSVSLVHIHFSRDTYTEPLQLLLGFGALWALGRAVQHPRMAVVGGIALGASLLIRLDASLTLLILPAAALHVVLVGERLRGFGRSLLIAAATCVPFVVVAWADLVVYSPSYWHSLRRQVVLAWVLVVSATVMVVLVRSRAGAFAAWVRVHRRRIASAATWLLGAGAIFVWVVRPLFTTGRGEYVSLVAGLLGREGADPDPYRSLAELSGIWLWWYLGALVAAAAIGSIVMVHRAIRRPDVRATMFLVMGGALTALYLWEPRITPDHIWAMRRFLPVVIPGAIVIGAWALAEVGGRIGGSRLRAAWAGVAVLVAMSGAITTIPAWGTSTYQGSEQMVTSICDDLPADVALFGLPDSDATVWGAALRIRCGTPVVVAAQPYVGLMMDRARDRGYQVLWFGSECPLGEPALLSYDRSFSRLERTILRPPSQLVDDVVRLDFTAPPGSRCWPG